MLLHRHFCVRLALIHGAVMQCSLQVKVTYIKDHIGCHINRKNAGFIGKQAKQTIEKHHTVLYNLSRGRLFLMYLVSVHNTHSSAWLAYMRSDVCHACVQAVCI